MIMKEIFTKERTRSITIFIIALIVFIIGVVLTNNKEMQNAEIGNLLDGVIGNTPKDNSISIYYIFAYGLLYLGFSAAILSINALAQSVVVYKLNKYNYYKFGVLIFSVSSIIFFYSMIETHRFLNEMVISLSKKGVAELNLYLKSVLVLKNISYLLFVVAVILLVIWHTANRQGKLVKQTGKAKNILNNVKNTFDSKSCYCVKCGSKMSDDDLFCRRCGTAVRK